MKKFHHAICAVGLCSIGIFNPAFAGVVYVGSSTASAPAVRHVAIHNSATSSGTGRSLSFDQAVSAGRGDDGAYAGGGMVITTPTPVAAAAPASAASPTAALPASTVAPSSVIKSDNGLNRDVVRSAWAKKLPSVSLDTPQISTKANILQENSEQKSIDALIKSGQVPAKALSKSRGYSPDTAETIETNQKASRIVRLPHSSYGPRNGGEGLYFAADGDNLYSVLQQWAGLNGWKVQYDAQLSYPLDSSVSLHGSFVECAASLLEAFRKSVDPAPQYKFYNVNKVLRIWNYDDGL